MGQVDHTRRRMLSVGSIVSLVALAGCASSSDDEGDGTEDIRDGDGEGDAETSESNAESGEDVWDVDIPNDPAFLADPDVVGPAEDARFVLSTSVTRSIEEYDRFEITFDAVALHRDGDDDVTVPVEVAVDLTAYEHGATGDLITLVWAVGIPTGTYTSLTLDVTPVEIVHESDGDVTDAFEDPPVSEFAADDGVDVLDDDAFGARMRLVPDYDFGTSTLEESLSVDTTTGEMFVLDPSRYEN